MDSFGNFCSVGNFFCFAGAFLLHWELFCETFMLDMVLRGCEMVDMKYLKIFRSFKSKICFIPGVVRIFDACVDSFF
jgi:hypothetical protein